MSSKLKVGLVLTVLIAVAVLAAFWATEMMPRHLEMMPRHSFEARRLPPQGDFVPGDFEYFYVAHAVISTINIAMLVILLITYVDIYSKTRSRFTVGLILFATVFLMKGLVASPFVTYLFRFRAFGLGPFVLLPSIFELAALSVLLYLSIKY